MTEIQIRALAVFAVGYVLITSRRLSLLPIGRPAGAMVGAVLMVAAGVLSPDEALARVELKTLTLLLGTMLITAHLTEAGFFSWLAGRLLQRVNTPRQLLAATVFGAGLLSAVLVNDTVCLMFGPLLTAVLIRTRLPAAPFLMALATSSNIGSAMTLTGNPQNMLVGTVSQLDYLRFSAHLAPATLLTLVLNWRLLLWMYSTELPAQLATSELGSAADPDGDSRLRNKSLLAIAVMLAGFSALPSIYLPWTALGSASLLLVLARRDPHAVFAQVDFPLLVFFAGLFVMVGGLDQVGLTSSAQAQYRQHFGDFSSEPLGVAGFTLFTLLGSNVFSNVPFVLVIGKWLLGVDPTRVDVELMWMLLALVSTLAGNLTLVGSVANIIVVETVRRHYALGFWEYLRFGVPSTLFTTTVGVLALLATRELLR